MPAPAKPPRPPAEIYRHAQAVRVLIRLLAAWEYTARAVRRTPDPVIGHLRRAGVFGDVYVPSSRQLVLVCRRRLQRLSEGAPSLRGTADVESWPEDTQAVFAVRRHRRADTIANTGALITAALALYEHFRQLDQEAAQAPSRMDELRKQKGAT